VEPLQAGLALQRLGDRLQQHGHQDGGERHQQDVGKPDRQ